MKTFQGTQGEWEYIEKWQTVRDSKGEPIHVCGVAIPMQANDEAIANSKLIAAAPDLLEALQEIARITERLTDFGLYATFGSDGEQAFRKGKQAITKALGE